MKKCFLPKTPFILHGGQVGASSLWPIDSKNNNEQLWPKHKSTLCSSLSDIPFAVHEGDNTIVL
jgi:hypothetical protein